MTQLTGTLRLNRNNALYVAALVAVAAVGISFGRWVVPAGDSTGSGDAVNSSATSPAAVIAERHFEQRGAFPEVAVAAVVNAPVENAAHPATIIAERHFEARGGYGEISGGVAVTSTVDRSPASVIAERHFETRGAYGELDTPARTEGVSAAEAIAQRKFESGSLDAILFGDN